MRGPKPGQPTRGLIKAWLVLPKREPSWALALEGKFVGLPKMPTGGAPLCIAVAPPRPVNPAAILPAIAALIKGLPSYIFSMLIRTWAAETEVESCELPNACGNIIPLPFKPVYVEAVGSEVIANWLFMVSNLLLISESLLREV